MQKHVQGVIALYRNIIIQPREFFRDVSDKNSLVKPLVFAVVNSVLMFIFSLFSGGAYSGIFGPVEYALSLVFLAPLILLFVYVESLILHGAAKLFRGKGVFRMSLLVVCYTSAVSPLTALPYVGLLASLYGVYLTIVGFEVVHQFKRSRAVAAVLIPFLLVLLTTSIVVTMYDDEIKSFIEKSALVSPTPSPTISQEPLPTGGTDYPQDYPTGYEQY